MTAPFPCNYTIGWRTHQDGIVDGFHNVIDSWSDPVNRKVIGWTTRRVLSRDGVHEVEDTDHLKLQVPNDFDFQVKDKAVIPGRGEYLVEGIEDASEGFHGWKPGRVLSLLRGEG